MKKYIIKIFVSIISYLSKRVILFKKPFVIGITGSIGKTTCRKIISQTLSHLLQDTAFYTPSKNYNNEIGLCLGILSIDDYSPTVFGWMKVIWTAIKRLFSRSKYDILVLEYGIDSPGDMDQLLSVCLPDIGVMTKIDLVHSANFGSDPSNIFSEKSKLIRGSKSTAFLNKDDSFTDNILDDIKVDKFIYGEHDADIGFDSFDLIKDQDGKINSISTIYIGKSDQVRLSSNLISKFMISYAAIGICISQLYAYRNKVNLPLDKLNITYDLEPGRFGLFYVDKGVIVDGTYNASPQSMLSAIQNTLDIRDSFFQDYKLILILGEMRELGSNSISAHEDIAKNISNISDHTIRVSGDARCGYDYACRSEDFFVEGSMEVEDTLGSIFDRYEDSQKFIILFKSSQGEIYLEEAIKPWIDKKYHNQLPRQDLFWRKKKLFLGKFVG